MDSFSSAKIDLKSSLLLILFLIFHFGAISQSNDSTTNNVKVQIQFRPRLELRDGAFKPLAKKEEPAVLISERIRLNIDYSYKKIFTLKLSPQSVGVWGQANGVQTAESGGNKIALFEAWTNFFLNNKWDIKLGRQVISLDDERFFGELDWAQGGRAHDAVMVQFKKNKWNLKSYLAFNQNYKALYNNNTNNPSGNLFNNTDAIPYKTMQTVWANVKINKTENLSLLVTNIGFQQANSANNTNATVNYSQTFGANYFNTKEAVSGNISAYFQTGKNNNGAKTQAFLVAGNVGFKINNKLKLTIGSDWVSGNDVGQIQPSTTNKSFNPYFHTGHKFYGNMDYFFAGSSHKNAGLLDNYFTLQVKATSKLNTTIAIHQFSTTNKVNNINVALKKNLGQEADISFAYKPNSFTSIIGGYSFYLTTPTIHFLKNTTGSKDYQQWLWISVNVSPTIFISKF